MIFSDTIAAGDGWMFCFGEIDARRNEPTFTAPRFGASQIVQQLWGGIAESRQKLPIQDWHRELVKSRLADFVGHEEEVGLTREQVWRQVDEIFR